MLKITREIKPKPINGYNVSRTENLPFSFYICKNVGDTFNGPIRKYKNVQKNYNKYLKWLFTLSLFFHICLPR